MKNFFILLWLLLGFLVSFNTSFATEDFQTDEKFYIENYAVHINVDEDKTAHIIEDIDVYFTEPAHGIIRDILFNNDSVRDISISEQNQVNYYSNSVSIKIGDPNHTITGPHKYEISYNYKYEDNENEFYHNIIGTDWNTYIKNASFDIIMPANVDPEQVGLSIGEHGTKGFQGGAVYTVKDNIITCNTERILKPNEGITIRIGVPEGYFTNNSSYTTEIPTTDEKFYIENYNVHINVDKNKIAHVVEDIDAYFTKSAHGIIRNIPFKNGTVKDIRISEKNQKFYYSDRVDLKIGNPDRTISGPHNYKISYKYIYDDDKNEFYHNIIGTEWDTYIKNASFEITMPENIDPEKVGLSIGKYGTRGFESGAVYTVKDNIITGHTQRILKSNEGITVRVEVHDGYFKKYHNYFKIFMQTISIIAMILLSWHSLKIWNKYGKDNPIIPIVNFYPPKELNAAEIELVYKGSVSRKGIIALIIELASEDYIKIHSEGKHFKLEKIRSYEDNDKAKQDLMLALFKKGKDIISDEELKKSKTFYNKCSNIESMLNKKQKDFVCNNTRIAKKALLSIYGIALCLILSISNYEFNPIIIGACFITFLIMFFMTCIMHILIAGNRIIGAIALLLVITITIFSRNPVAITALASLIISYTCLFQLPKRTAVGQTMLNNITGLKKFIQVAEKNRLAQLVNENPKYFYNVLPIAYVLDISNKWIKKFETIMTIQPEWYDGDFNHHSFDKFTRDMHKYSKPSYNNGGISSGRSGSSHSSSSGGGGHSGGGGGGGGGSSW